MAGNSHDDTAEWTRAGPRPENGPTETTASAPAAAASTPAGGFFDIDHLLPAVYTKYKRAKAQQLASSGLTQQQNTILLLLDKYGPLKVSGIAEMLHMVDSNASNICARLERMGLVTRTRLKDNQRVVEIALTSAADERLTGIKATMERFGTRIHRRITASDIEAIRLGLERLDALLDMTLE